MPLRSISAAPKQNVKCMNTENHIAVIFASLLWSISASLLLFIFWPIVAVASLGVGFIVAKLLKTIVLKPFAVSGLVSIVLGALVIFVFGVIGYTQQEWQSMLYIVVVLHVISFYFGGFVCVWKYRACNHT